MCGLCSRRLLTVWKTSKIPSAFTRSRTVLKAQKVPVRPAPALKQSRYTYHTCCLELAILRGESAEEGQAEAGSEKVSDLCSPLSPSLVRETLWRGDGFLLPFLCALRMCLWDHCDNFYTPCQLDSLLSNYND